MVETCDKWQSFHWSFGACPPNDWWNQNTKSREVELQLCDGYLVLTIDLSVRYGNGEDIHFNSKSMEVDEVCSSVFILTSQLQGLE